MFALLWPATQCTESNTFIGACDDQLQPMLIAVLFNRLHRKGQWYAHLEKCIKFIELQNMGV